MRKLRALVRLFRLANESLFLFLVYTLGRAVMVIAPVRMRRAWRRVMYRAWARRVTSLFGVKPAFVGERPIGSFVLAANHLSYIDVPVIASHVDVAFIAKAEVERWPLVGMLASSVGTIFVNRESRRDAVRVAEEMRKSLAEERGVAVFPEGTATDGTSVLPFKPALLDVAARDGVPAYGATLIYDTGDPAYPASQFVAWAGDDDFIGHVWRALQLREIRATVYFGPARIVSDRKELAAQLWTDVNERLTSRR